MKDLRAAKRILGIDVARDRKKGTFSLTQSLYVKKVLKAYGMLDSKMVSIPIPTNYKLKYEKGLLSQDEMDYMNKVPYSNIVGCLMYAMVATRPDIAYGVGVVSRFMSCPSKVHWQAVKWLLRYLNGTSNLRLVYGNNEAEGNNIKGYCDADYGADLDKRRPITSYAFTVGGNLISWKSTLQHIVALFTTEAECMVLTKAVKEAIWLNGITTELGLKNNSVTVHCDS